MSNEKIIGILTEELIGGGISADTAEAAARIAAENGWRRQRLGEWIKDGTYAGVSKEIFVCSVCNHWQSAKKRSDKVFYMNYCPFCGARMRSDEKETVDGDR